MAFDGFFTKKIIEELRENIIFSKINKINNISSNEFIITIRKNKNMKLFISASANSSRIQLTNNSYENPTTPSNFCTVLRKYISGGIIVDIEQINNDRIVFFKIKNFDELGYEKYFFIIIELMGKHANIILTDENKTIIESLKNSYSIEFKRSTISNMKYTLPPTEKKINPFNFQEYEDKTYDFENKNKFLLKNFYGVSSFLNKYILSKNENLITGLIDFCKNIDSFYTPTVIYFNNKTDFYFFDYAIENKNKSITFDSLSTLLDFYYMDTALSSTNKNIDKTLFNFVKTKKTRLENKLTTLINEYNNCINKENYKLKGQLLISNIYQFKNNVPEIVKLQNFYSENLEEIEIHLDPNISIEKNSEKYFNLYKKNNRTIHNLEEQIKITKNDIIYFETLNYQLENADKSDILEIKNELEEYGYLKNKKTNIKKKQKNKYSILKYNNIDIYIGKNNIQNDTITNKLARRDYLWFHAKDVPGSHVVIFSSNPDKDTIDIAAMLAGYFSKNKNEDNVIVDSTLIKYVKKISGAKPGMVTYTNQNSIKVKINKIKINELLNSL